MAEPKTWLDSRILLVYPPLGMQIGEACLMGKLTAASSLQVRWPVCQSWVINLMDAAFGEGQGSLERKGRGIFKKRKLREGDKYFNKNIVDDLSCCLLFAEIV